MTIGPAEINIFRNKRYSFDKSQRPPWPQQLLTKIKQPFSIDSLIVLPTSITYRELLESHNDPVTIDFSNITMQMGNLSNQNNFQKSKKPLNINARAKIFNKGLITVNIKFDLNDPNFYHEVEGNLSPLNINTFNDIVEKNALLSIEGGKVNTFRFNFNADKNKATGKLFFGYENLKINVMEFRNGNTQKSKLNTFMANNFVIHSKNPKGNTFEPQNINYQRDPSRSILNYWWKSIYSSAKITLGLKNPKVGKK
jgi:hypothetical protein